MADTSRYTRTPDDVPENVLEALRAADTQRERARAAQKAVAELASAARDQHAEQRDRDDAVKAAAAGKPIPEPVAVPTLASDRAKAARALEAHTTALAQRFTDVDNARRDALEAEADDEQQARIEAIADLTEQAEALAVAIEQEHAARGRHAWLRTGQMQQGGARLAPWDIAPGLQSYGIGPGRSDARYMIEPAAAVVRRIVAAAFNTEES